MARIARASEVSYHIVAELTAAAGTVKTESPPSEGAGSVFTRICTWDHCPLMQPDSEMKAGVVMDSVQPIGN